MRKKFKKLMVAAVMTVSMISAAVVGNAASESGKLSSPGGRVGDWVSGDWYRLYKNAETVYASDTNVRFESSTFGEMQQSLSSGKRTVYLKLYDADTNNADDLLRKGSGYIINRHVISLVMDTDAYTTDWVDAEGENGAELYLSMAIGTCYDDPVDPYYASGLFQYELYVEQD